MDFFIAKKVGMTSIFDEDNKMVPVTVLDVKENQILAYKSVDKDGYSAVVVGREIDKKEKRKSILNRYKNKKKPKYIKEFRIVEEEIDNSLIGQQVVCDFDLEKVKFVDVVGKSKGKGFQGVMKRHNFAGGPGGHGSHFHRAPGSIGNCSDPGRVFKGRKMPGRMGGASVTTQNLKVMKVDVENNLLVIKGSVAGCNGSIVYIKRQKKKK